MKIPLDRVAGVLLYMGFLTLLHCTPNPIYRQYHASDHGKVVPKAARKAAPEQSVIAASSAQKSDPPKNDAPPSDARRSDEWDLDNKDTTGQSHVAFYGEKAWYADGGHFHVPTTRVRVILRQHVSQTRIVSSGTMAVSGATEGMTLRGTATIERGASPGRARYIIDGGENEDIALPCTLYSGSEFNIVTIDDVPYRGSEIGRAHV